MKSIRYILTLPAWGLGFIIALVASLTINALMVPMLCPTAAAGTVFCYRYPDPQSFPLWLYYFGASLAAVLMVTLPALVTASRRFEVAVVYFILGSAFAISLAAGISDLVPVALSAILSGFLTLLIIKRLTRTAIIHHTGSTL